MLILGAPVHMIDARRQRYLDCPAFVAFKRLTCGYSSAVISAAGPIAETMVTGLPSVGDYSDRARVDQSNDPSRARREAAHYMRGHWTAVDRIARALFTSPIMYGGPIRAIWQRSP